MVQLHVQGDEAILRAFSLIQDKSARADLLDQIGAFGVSSTQQRFMDERGPGGVAWKKSYRAKHQGGTTLRDQGYLYDSLTHDFNDSSVSWGTNMSYAAIHQTGGTIRPKSAKALAFRLSNGQFVLTKKVEIPARPFLGIDAEDSKEIAGTVTDWLKECFRAR